MQSKALFLIGLLLLSPPVAWAMEFVDIPSGCFRMGSDPNFEAGNDNEQPQHKVCVNAFQMGKTEVTQAEWVAVMGGNPSKFKGRTNPVEQVSWDDVQEFIDRLNRQEGTSQYRLPTEAEWEYAARAGTTSPWSCGDDESCLGSVAWYDANAGERTHPVGQKQPNPWGLYDMHGNVWEWVQDCWHDSYRGAPTDGSAWSSGGCDQRVLRGGSWGNSTRVSRAADRINFSPGYRNFYLGFRLARTR